MEDVKKSEKQTGEPESVAMPEGASVSQGLAGSSTPGDSVQTFPFQSQGAVSLNNFDLLATLGEAEQFALTLKGFADLIPDPRWQAISKAMDIAIQAHDRINQARANS